jgi:hypothetical protein
MQFIESIFGFAPDSGSGVLELWLISIPVIAVILLATLGRAINRRASV